MDGYDTGTYRQPLDAEELREALERAHNDTDDSEPTTGLRWSPDA